MKKNKKTIILILVVILAIFVLYQNKEVFAPTKDPQAIEQKQDWQKHTSADKKLSFWYPKEANINIENEKIKITLIGPNSHMSEITDGFTFFIDTKEIEDRDLSIVADDIFEEETHLLESITSPERETLAGREGYYFEIEGGLGNQINYFLFTENDKVIITNHMIADPDDQGYEESVNIILENINLID